MDHPATSSQVTAICAIGIGLGWKPDRMEAFIVERLGDIKNPMRTRTVNRRRA